MSRRLFLEGRWLPATWKFPLSKSPTEKEYFYFATLKLAAFRNLNIQRRQKLIMRGQYRIISEIILFSVGILITGYVLINFNSLQSSTAALTLDDQMNGVADAVATAIIKVASEDNTS